MTIHAFLQGFLVLSVKPYFFHQKLVKFDSSVASLLSSNRWVSSNRSKLDALKFLRLICCAFFVMAVKHTATSCSD